MDSIKDIFEQATEDQGVAKYSQLVVVCDHVSRIEVDNIIAHPLIWVQYPIQYIVLGIVWVSFSEQILF